ncbi:hypothetical protein HYX10_05255 [Candidatus Woesearchaeota archaeon]|nr:hypothetical protein [Candidatus Woesearchaeota archaeon]
MVNILINNKRYDLLDFEYEEEFEKAVIENSKYLFGSECIYIDVKKRIGKNGSYNKGVPDGYLIDLTNKKQPQLYFIENELVTHDIYNHISEQIVRFSAAIKTSQNQIRNKLLEIIKGDPQLKEELTKHLNDTPFTNIDELMNFLVDKRIKIVLVVDEATSDLNDALDVFRDRPDVVTMKRFVNDNNVSYVYEPMREELQDLEARGDLIRKNVDLEFDTIVCPAFEDGFKHAYLDNNAWWAIRLSQKAREHLRYLAIYEKSPIAAVRHYAEIERIEPYKDSGKYKVYLKNKKTISSIELDKDSSGISPKGVAPQGPRFTSLSKLLKAKRVSELWV